MQTQIFPYGRKELDYLSATDARLAAAINKIGKIEREVNSDIFAALISSIIAQQISGKAAQTVQNRILALTNDRLTAESLSTLSADSLQACGLSANKVKYIIGAAQAAIDKTIDFDSLSVLSDEEVIQKLTSLAGVGRWTAEMLLIFALSRPDVISFNDFGIRKGMEILYNIENLSKKDFTRLSRNYHPYATVASFYLWHIANNGLSI